MAILSADLTCDEVYPPQESGEARGLSYDSEVTVRIANDAAADDEDQDPGPLTWLNSARITTDPADDAVHCLVSIGDPRGAFCFTVRRLPDGRIVLYVPYPGDPTPHENIKEIRPGTLEVIGHEGGPRDFSDPEPEESDA